MKEYYCWRSEMVVPMLEEHEWQLIAPLLDHLIKRVKEYREKTGCDIKTALLHCKKPAIDKYFELTGVKETNYNAIWKRRLSDYGKECPNCGHLFRTPTATYCTNCCYQ